MQSGEERSYDFVDISYISLDDGEVWPHNASSMSSRASVERLLPAMSPKLSAANALRLKKTLGLIDDQGQAVLSDVLDALYPRQERGAALTSFRQFRAALSEAASDAGVRLSLEGDGQTRTVPEERVVWFEAEDRVAEEVVRLVDAQVGDVKKYRIQQDVEVPRLIRFFVSYAHKDTALKDGLMGWLSELLDLYPEARFELWSDGNILPGQKWRAEIETGLGACEFGLLLVSPSFLASRFIAKDELPYLLENKAVIPVGLRPLLFDGSIDLKGLQNRHVFFDGEGKAYSERAVNSTREAFARQLFGKITALLNAPPQPAPAKPKLDHHMRSIVGEFDEKGFVHTEGVETIISTHSGGTPEIDGTRRKDAIEFLTDWLKDEKAPPYCALLGEYGMGKTTTCKALARDLLDRREKGEKVPLPVYLDLRHVGESADREMSLQEILTLILKRSWKAGPNETTLTAKEMIGLVQNEGALVIWDGLDEVLVHLSANAGQMFTRQLFSILQGKPRRGRMLISCRTHYFRTLRDQQNHFRAEDRDGVRAEDYRAPFVLLPFTIEQIREYLKRTFGEGEMERVLETFRAVHNLMDMAERPYTLSLLVKEVAQIERWKAEGRRVTGLMLYRHMVLSWLERDQGKHQLSPDHKQVMMEHCAAALWRTGARFWTVGDLEQWLIDLLEARPDLAARYRGKAPELLLEDLRTATFLVREGEDRFRFAHASLQEYFLAGYLRRALVEDRPEAWDLPRGVSPETLDFLGQWLEEETLRRDTALTTLGRLRDLYRARASELAFQYFLLAHRKRYLVPTAAGFQLPGAKLYDWEISGTAETPLVLVGMNLEGARLVKSRWRHCNLREAGLDGADGTLSEWLGCNLSESSWRQASLEGAIFRECRMPDATFEEARCDRTQFLRCSVGGGKGLPAGRPEALYAPGGGSSEPCSAQVSVASGHSGKVMGCAFSPDGRRIVSASDDKTLRLWDAATGESLLTLQGHSRAVNGCAFSPDGRRIVSASDDQTLRIWDAATGESLLTLQGHYNGVLGCAYSPDGRCIVSGSYNQTLRIWDAATGESLLTLRGHLKAVRGCTYSPDGRRIVSASDDQTLRIWDAATGESLLTLPGHFNWVTVCAYTPDGRRIVSASYDQTLRVWDAATGESLLLLQGRSGWVMGCGSSPDGRRIVSASYHQTLHIWDAATGETLLALRGHSSGANGCAHSPNGRHIVAASQDCTLRIWDASAGTTLLTLQGHSLPVKGCAYSPDAQHIVSASDDATLRIWDAATGESLLSLAGHSLPVNGCAYSPDGKRIVSASHDLTLRIWDAATGESLLTLQGHSNGVMGCAYSSDGRRIVSASTDQTLRIWDAATGEALLTLQGHSKRVMGCAYSPDGRRIVSASNDGMLRIWDAATGNSLLTLQGHHNAVLGCAYSPDGRRIVSGSDDRTLRIWDAATGKNLLTLRGHDEEVVGCAYSPDGRRIVSASYDGTIRPWDASTGAEVVPTLHQLNTPEGPDWCSVDHPNNRILACGPEAWRVLGWILPDPVHGPEWLPAETFGPLPVLSVKTRTFTPFLHPFAPPSHPLND